MLAVFLLYTTSIGVNASQSGSNLASSQVSPNLQTTTKTVYKTTTIYKNDFDTITKTSTSFVCCQTTTSTVTSTTTAAGTITTVTQTPNVMSDKGHLQETSDLNLYDVVGPLGSDCVITFTVSTTGEGADGSELKIYAQNSAGNSVWQGDIANGFDNTQFTITFSADYVNMFLINMPYPLPATVYIDYSWTAICP
jgi:hypothetical protein